MITKRITVKLSDLDQSGDPEAQSKEFEDNLSANEFNGAKHFLHNVSQFGVKS